MKDLFSFKKISIALICMLSIWSLQAQTVFRGVVKDSESNNPIANAKILVSGQGVGVLSNAQGIFSYRKYNEILNSQSSLHVHAQGYEPIVIEGKGLENLMNTRASIILDPSDKKLAPSKNVYKKVGVFYDLSESMRTREPSAEVAFLKDFMEEFEVNSFDFVAFNSSITKQYTDVKSLDPLKTYMMRGDIAYQGFSDYDILPQKDYDAIILLSDARPFSGDVRPGQNTDVFVRTSGGVIGNIDYANDLSTFFNGSLAHLSEGSQGVEEGQTYLSEMAKTSVFGQVTYDGKGLGGASILVGDSFSEFRTDDKGNFNIDVGDASHINVSYYGMQPQKVAVSDVEDFLKIELTRSQNILDEVILTSKNEDKIPVGGKDLTGFDGRLSATGDAYLVQGDFPKNATYLEDLLKSSFPELRYAFSSSGYIFTFKNASVPIYVDGLEAKELPAIEAAAIESVILKTVPIETNRYGPYLRTGPAIIVTTLGNPQASDLLVKDNNYTEQVAAINRASYADRPIRTGTIRSGGNIIQGATIIRKGALDEYTTKADGTFSAPLETGDIIQVSSLGMYPKLVQVEDGPIDIELIPKNELLDEVVVEGSTVVTAYGQEKKEKIGYAVNTLTSEQIRPNSIYLTDILRGQFAGVRVNGFGEEASVTIRSGSSTFGSPGGPIWVVDNNIQREIPTFIQVQDISTITVLKSAAAANKYGSIAIDGAIVITTKSASLYAAGANKVGSALAKGNSYEEKVLRLQNTAVDKSYIKELLNIPSITERYKKFQELEDSYKGDIEFYVDNAQYFASFDKVLAEQIIDKLAMLGQNSKKVLRVSAYLYESIAKFNKAQSMYKRVVLLHPEEAQSYRDLALIYKENGAYNDALLLYINMLGNQIKGVNFEGLEGPLRNELSHLIALHKDKIEFERLPNEWLRADYNLDLRMVINWTDPSVPFEFQFVNPNKKFYKWSHTLEEQRERLNAENRYGFQTEEFIIDDAPSGDWLVNVQYLGFENDYVIPPFLKYTIYKNYGTKEETKEIRVVKLFEQSEKVTLDDFKI